MSVLVHREAGFFLVSSTEHRDSRHGRQQRFAGLGTDRRPLRVDVARQVGQMPARHRQLAAARTPPERTVLQNQIDATDAQIDRLVYELYGLTDDEIAIVEGSARSTISD